MKIIKLCPKEFMGNKIGVKLDPNEINGYCKI